MHNSVCSTQVQGIRLRRSVVNSIDIQLDGVYLVFPIHLRMMVFQLYHFTIIFQRLLQQELRRLFSISGEMRAIKRERELLQSFSILLNAQYSTVPHYHLPLTLRGRGRNLYAKKGKQKSSNPGSFPSYFVFPPSFSSFLDNCISEKSLLNSI